MEWLLNGSHWGEIKWNNGIIIFFLANSSRIEPIIVRKSWQQNLERINQPTSAGEAEEDGAQPAFPVSYGPRPNHKILDPVKIALNIYHHKSTLCQSDTQTNHFHTTAFHPLVQNKLSPILKAPVVFNS